MSQVGEISKLSTIAIDLGTTSIKAGLFRDDGEITYLVQYKTPEMRVTGGNYESNALAYAEIVDQALSDCISKKTDCTSLGICSQRSSFLVWERTTGIPLTPLISWQDNRGESSCMALKNNEEIIWTLSGLPLAPYYFAPKLKVLLQDNPGWLEKLLTGQILVGTLDTFIIWRWTGGRHFITDASMAARTLLMDIHQHQWSSRLCEIFNIPLHCLPKIVASTGIDLRLDNGLVLQSSAGDQSCALIASLRNDRSEVLVNLGTGCFVLRYLSRGSAIPKGYIQTLIYLDQSHQAHYAIEGTINSIASLLNLYPIPDCTAEDFARDEILCTAEPSGLGAPYLGNDIGLIYSQSVDHLSPLRIGVLLLEYVIFRVARILEEFNRESPIKQVFLSGGLSRLACLQQGIALCAPYKVMLLEEKETSLKGAAQLSVDLSMANFRKYKDISTSPNNHKLRIKYNHWKIWFDDLLISRKIK